MSAIVDSEEGSVESTIAADDIAPPLATPNASTMMLVDKPGMLSVIQDRGRYGYQRLGVPVNGVMDEWSHRVANILVGNDEWAASLEITLLGPSIRFNADVLIAVSGAEIGLTIDGVAAPLNRALIVRKHANVVFGKCARGARAYLAVRGGFDVAPVLESRSTFVRGGFGGMEGRALVKEDRVAIGEADIGYPYLHASLLRDDGGNAAAASAATSPSFVCGPALPIESHDAMLTALRFIPGPQWSNFTEEAQNHFVASDYRIHARSDRMGYRLEGPMLSLSAPLEMISEAIILMADRQGAGGYPKIAYVITADLPALAQAMPGELLGFEPVDIDTAEQAYLEQEDALARLQHAARLTLHDVAGTGDVP
jgi:biotin-dependent carboxylase-like uncharacterized protein